MNSNNKQGNETVIESHSYVFGGLIGSYDRITNRPYSAENNNYYQKYNNYIDKEYYEEGYSIAYTKEGLDNVFSIYQQKDPEELLKDIEYASKPYECISKGGIIIENGSFKIINQNIVNKIIPQDEDSERTR